MMKEMTIDHQRKKEIHQILLLNIIIPPFQTHSWARGRHTWPLHQDFYSLIAAPQLHGLIFSLPKVLQIGC